MEVRCNTKQLMELHWGKSRIKAYILRNTYYPEKKGTFDSQNWNAATIEEEEENSLSIHHCNYHPVHSIKYKPDISSILLLFFPLNTHRAQNQNP